MQVLYGFHMLMARNLTLDFITTLARNLVVGFTTSVACMLKRGFMAFRTCIVLPLFYTVLYSFKHFLSADNATLIIFYPCSPTMTQNHDSPDSLKNGSPSFDHRTHPGKKPVCTVRRFLHTPIAGRSTFYFSYAKFNPFHFTTFSMC